MLLSELARQLNLTLDGADREISGVNTLADAGPDQVSFLANPKYRDQLALTRAAAVILTAEDADGVETALISDTPYLAFARAVQLFARPQGSFSGQSGQSFIHPEASVADSATIAPNVFIGAGAEIGSDTTLFPGCYVGEECRVGQGCTLYPNAVLMAGTEVGDRVTLHAGVVLGSDGFGFAQSQAGMEKFPQIGRVVVEDDVEIGANSTIDRAALGETRIGRGTKIDNLVQLGHNVLVGKNSIIVAQVGVAGSTTIGDQVILAGQVGVAGHLTIGDRCRVGAQSGIGRDLEPGTDVSGTPAMPHGTYLRASTTIPRLPDMARRIRKLEKELEKMQALQSSGAFGDEQE
jgi:UDP-3-O-[3-hydroxymyristoyl] glucosamine N-acyltransferase